MHSIFSDGELLPSEIARRASVLDHEAIAITDHVDASNMDCISRIKDVILDIKDNWDIEVVPGAEITHAPAEIIGKLAGKARKLGAEIIVVHGETLVEPVIEGTNMAAVNCPEVDILAHPGLITREDVEIAKDNDITLEISARAGHSLSNGHVAKMALEVGANLILDTDTHSPEDIISCKKAAEIALGAGIPLNYISKILRKNPLEILKRKDLITKNL